MQIRHILIKITFKSFPLKPLNQIKPNVAGMAPGWVPFKIMSDSPCPPFKMAAKLKIEKRGDEIKKNLLLCNY